MLSLAELMRMAQAYHPMHPERLQSLKDASFARFIVRHIATRTLSSACVQEVDDHEIHLYGGVV